MLDDARNALKELDRRHRNLANEGLFDTVAEALAQPASPPPTQGWEEAMRVLEKFHDKWHPRTDGYFCTPQTCDLSRHLATLRSHLSGRETKPLDADAELQQACQRIARLNYEGNAPAPSEFRELTNALIDRICGLDGASEQGAWARKVPDTEFAWCGHWDGDQWHQEPARRSYSSFYYEPLGYYWFMPISSPTPPDARPRK